MDGPLTWCCAAAAATAAAAAAAGCGLSDRGAAGVLCTSFCHTLMPARPASVCRPIILASGARCCPPA